jgi:hypothetical protein
MLGHSRTSGHFMEPENSVPNSQQLSTCSLSWARPIQSTPPHSISQRSILILSTHTHPCLPSGLFPSGISTNNLYASLFSTHSCYMLCPSQVHKGSMDKSYWQVICRHMYVKLFSTRKSDFIYLSYFPKKKKIERSSRNKKVWSVGGGWSS